MRTQTVVSITATVLALVAGSAFAQRTVDLKQPATTDGRVTIESFSGSVRVVGWDRNEVAVTGKIGAEIDDVRLSGGPHHVRVEVEPRHQSHHTLHGATADIEVRVPAACEVEVNGLNAKVDLSGLTGRMNVNTVEGDVSVTGPAKEVEIEAVSGDVTVSGIKERIRAQTVNGVLILRGAGGDVTASTVNGRLEIAGSAFSRGSFETVSGDLRFDGDVVPDGSLDVESVSGSIELMLPAKMSAAFSVETFSGSVTNELGPPARRTSEYVPEQELQFQTGSGGARIEIRSMSGNITLKKK